MCDFTFVEKRQTAPSKQANGFYFSEEQDSTEINVRKSYSLSQNPRLYKEMISMRSYKKMLYSRLSNQLVAKAD